MDCLWFWESAKLPSYYGSFLYYQFCSSRWDCRNSLFAAELQRYLEWYYVHYFRRAGLPVEDWLLVCHYSFPYGVTLLQGGAFLTNQKEQLETYIGEVVVEIDGVTVSCPGLLDTGNQLCDPLTRIPVMVMESTLWEGHLPAAWKGRLTQDGADRLLLETDGQSFAWQDRMRLVPYRGINRGASFMLALKPDLVSIKLGEEVFYSKRVLIGLDGGTLSGDGAYRAVIHPDLTQKESTTDSALSS